MLDHTVPVKIREAHLKEQMEVFLRSEALVEIFDLLGTDRDRIGKTYNGRKGKNGKVVETLVLKPDRKLAPVRKKLYPLLAELGFFHINKPLSGKHSRILVLGGALNACFVRTRCASEWKDPGTLSIDGLSCYRPVHPKERSVSAFSSFSETEFGVLSDAFCKTFGLPENDYQDDFRGDRNLNGISCIRRFPAESGSCLYRVYAAPSCEPELRRADTKDTLKFFVENGGVSPGDTLLAITHNPYCNRQFLQLAYYIIKNDIPVDLDVVGCTPDDQVETEKTYDPFRQLQVLIGILDWIGQFTLMAAEGRHVT